MKTYDIEYDFTSIAVVEIDEIASAEPIKEMVEFWSGWEDAVEANNGDYTQTWLKNLAKFIIRNGRPPNDEENWVPLDGNHGISLKTWEAWFPEDEAIDIRARQ